MDNVIEWFIQQIMKQGFSIALMAVVSYYLYNELNVVKADLKKAQAEIVKYLNEDRIILVKLSEEMGSIIEQNTKILQLIFNKL